MTFETATPRNKLLAHLPPRDLERLRPLLEPVPLHCRRVLHYDKAPMEYMYFVEQGLVSVVAQIDRRKAVEVWLIGREGVTGLPIILGGSRSPHRRVVQLGGRALRMRGADIRRAFDEVPSLRKILLRYLQVVLVQCSQFGACNSLHSVQQRLARWLLCAQDRQEQDVLLLTHDMLARMLGTRRASVTECIARLQQSGALDKSRGLVRILDRAQLERLVCPCYSVITAEYDRMERDLRAVQPPRSYVSVEAQPMFNPNSLA